MASEHTQFGEVRSLLARGAREESFAAVCRLWPEGDVPQAVVEYVLGVTRRWPDRVPCAVPELWQERVMARQPCAGVAMCKTLRLRVSSVGDQWWAPWVGDHVTHRFERIELDEPRDESPSLTRSMREFFPFRRRDAIRPPLPTSLFEARELFSRVTQLHLRDLHIDEHAFVALARSGCGSSLRALGMTRCQVDLEDLRVFAGTALAMPLRRLVLRGLSDSRGRPHADELVAFWASSVLLERVEHLDLSGHALSPFSIEALAGSKRARAVRELLITGQDESWEVLSTLAMNYWSSQLHALSVRGQVLESEALQVFLRTPHLSALRHLDLAHAWISAEGLEPLLGSPVMHRLESLDLSHDHLGDLGAYAIASASPFASLKRLNLAGNDITDEGIGTLHASELCARLEHVDLRDNPITPELMAQIDGIDKPPCAVIWQEPSAHRARVADAIERVDRRSGCYLVGEQLDALTLALERSRWAPSWFHVEDAHRDEITLGVRPYETPPDNLVEWLATFPELAYLTGVDISESLCDVSFLQHVLGNPRVQSVRHLHARRCGGMSNAELLGWMDAWPGSARLESFAMSSNSRRRIRRVMGSIWFGSLSRFVLECEPEIFEVARQIHQEYELGHVELVHFPPDHTPRMDTIGVEE